MHTPGAGAALKGESASGPETTAGTPGRRSSAPLVWAAGSAVLGVLLFFSALTQFVTANLKLLWQIVLVAAILGVLTGAFERPLKRLGTFVHGWNFIWSITAGLVSVGLVVLAITVPRNSTGLEKGSGAVLFVASLASLVESVVILAGRSRPRTDSDT